MPDGAKFGFQERVLSLCTTISPYQACTALPSVLTKLTLQYHPSLPALHCALPPLLTSLTLCTTTSPYQAYTVHYHHSLLVLHCALPPLLTKLTLHYHLSLPSLHCSQRDLLWCEDLYMLWWCWSLVDLVFTPVPGGSYCRQFRSWFNIAVTVLVYNTSPPHVNCSVLELACPSHGPSLQHLATTYKLLCVRVSLP